jgi:hypothetical protein
VHSKHQEDVIGMRQIAHTQRDQATRSHLSERQGGPMNLAIAVESKQHPKNHNDYRIWYLEIDGNGHVVNVGVKSKQEMVENLFENYRKTGKSNWRAFTKGAERSTPVEIFDFVSMNMHDNTHFGNLPTLSEFQNVLDTLQSRLEFRSIA